MATTEPRGVDVLPGRPGGARGGVQVALLLGASALYFWLAGALAARRPLWYDELLTLDLARLPSWSAFWAALMRGPDLSPPLYHAFAKFLIPWLGEGPLALRLPAIVGFWVMGLALYRFGARAGGAACGWTALLLPCVSGAFAYAIEARPYALVLAGAGVALACWQAAGEGRLSALVGLALALGLAIGSHLYGVLLAVPLGLAELARSRARRRLDLGVWAALGVGVAAPLVLLGPVIAHGRTRAADFWARPSFGGIANSYVGLLGAAITPLVAVAIVLALVLQRGRPGGDSGRAEPPAPATAEVVAAVGFALLPGFGWLLAVLVTGAFLERYVLPAVLGLALLLAFLVRRLAAGDRAARVAPALILAGWVGVMGPRQVGQRRGEARDRAALRERLAAAEPTDLPIVVAGPLSYLELTHDAPPGLAGRLVHVRTGRGSPAERSAERELRLLAPWVPLHLAEREDFLADHPRFLVYGPADAGLIASLLDGGSGRGLRLVGADLYLVEPTAGAEPAGP